MTCFTSGAQRLNVRIRHLQQCNAYGSSNLLSSVIRLWHPHSLLFEGSLTMDGRILLALSSRRIYLLLRIQRYVSSQILTSQISTESLCCSNHVSPSFSDRSCLPVLHSPLRDDSHPTSSPAHSCGAPSNGLHTQDVGYIFPVIKEDALSPIRHDWRSVRVWCFPQ